MQAKEFRIDGQTVRRNGYGIYFEKGGYNWTEVDTDDESLSNQGYHGRVVSPTYARKRIITFEGIIDKHIEDFERSLRYLQRLFSISLDKEKVLTIIDEFDNEREINTKVVENLETENYSEDMPNTAYRRRVVLESTSTPILTSAVDNIISGVEFKFAGNYLDDTNKLNNKLDKCYNLITTTEDGNQPVYPVIEIEALGSIDDYIKIHNYTEKNNFTLNVSAVAGDKIVIDSYNQTATLNGDDIITQREPGSVRPKIVGTIKFGIFDGDENLKDDDINITFIFSDTFL